MTAPPAKATTLSVGAFGATININLHGLTPHETHTLTHAWNRCPPHPGHPGRTLSASINTAAPETPADIAAPDADTLAHQLAARITLALIDLSRTTHLLLHACALAHPHTGRVIALIGPSGRGKTTAARTLGTRLSYITDETVALTGLTVHPYPKPLSLTQPHTHIKTHVSPDDLHLQPAPTTPLTLAAIALLDRHDNAPSTPTLHPIDLADAITDLVPQISYLTERPNPLHHLADTIARVGGIHRLEYCEATHLHDTIANLLDNPPAPIPNSWSPAPTASNAPTGIRRATVHDAIHDGQRTIVLHDNIVRVLDGIAPTLWNHANGTNHDQLTRTIVQQHGTPPNGDPHTLVRHALNHLTQLGLLHDDHT